MLSPSKKIAFFTVVGVITMILAAPCFAVSLGGLAENILGPTRGITQLMYGVCYVAGAGMLIMALTQYKAHRDNPSQVRLGTPVAFLIFGLVFILIPLIARYSSSSEYVPTDTETDRTSANAPLNYGKTQRLKRDNNNAQQRRPEKRQPLTPVNPEDADWYN